MMIDDGTDSIKLSSTDQHVVFISATRLRRADVNVLSGEHMLQLPPHNKT